MNASELRVGIIVRGLVLPEPIEVLVVTPLGDAIKIVGGHMRINCHAAVSRSHRELAPTWAWSFGFYPGTEPDDQTSGTARRSTKPGLHSGGHGKRRPRAATLARRSRGGAISATGQRKYAMWARGEKPQPP